MLYYKHFCWYVINKTAALAISGATFRSRKKILVIPSGKSLSGCFSEANKSVQPSICPFFKTICSTSNSWCPLPFPTWQFPEDQSGFPLWIQDSPRFLIHVLLGENQAIESSGSTFDRRQSLVHQPLISHDPLSFIWKDWSRQCSFATL